MDENTNNLVALANSTVAADMLEKLGAAYRKGWDDAEEVFRGEMADLLLRSGRERAELEARVEQLEEALRGLQAGMHRHIETMGTIAPVHPTIYHWKDHVDKVLASTESSLEHHKEEGDANS